LLISRLVAFALHCMFGTLDRVTMAMQQPTQLILAGADSRDLLEVSRKPFGRPRGKSVVQILGIGGHGFIDCRDITPVARLRLPGGFSGLRASSPRSRYSWRIRKTVSVEQPNRSAIRAIVSPKCDIVMIRQLRKTSFEDVLSRSKSKRFNSSWVKRISLPMVPSLQTSCQDLTGTGEAM
jgi:hypothetical protein